MIKNIEQFIQFNNFHLEKNEKEKLLLNFLQPQLIINRNTSKLMNNFYTNFNFDPYNFTRIEQIPAIPVTLFKKYDLITCEPENIVRILNSSATTTGIPSKIVLDKTTSLRQTKGLLSILKNFLGKKRRPYLVLDAVVNNKKGADTITARGAAIRGIQNFATKTVYALDSNNNGELILNIDRVNKFFDDYGDKEVICFGFTFMIWTNVISELKKIGTKYNFTKMKLLHSGGWKKLIHQKVEKKVFNRNVSETFGMKDENIIDFYGMVEQVGVVYAECEKGYKHVPDFADIIIRDLFSMKPVGIGETGLIQTISILPTSYPGQALLTEDIGMLIGIDNCECGRKGKYFIFKKRAEKAEVRGCGDTFAERMISLEIQENLK